MLAALQRAGGGGQDTGTSSRKDLSLLEAHCRELEHEAKESREAIELLEKQLKVMGEACQKYEVDAATAKQEVITVYERTRSLLSDLRDEHAQDVESLRLQFGKQPATIDLQQHTHILAYASTVDSIVTALSELRKQSDRAHESDNHETAVASRRVERALMDAKDLILLLSLQDSTHKWELEVLRQLYKKGEERLAEEQALRIATESRADSLRTALSSHRSSAIATITTQLAKARALLRSKHSELERVMDESGARHKALREAAAELEKAHTCIKAHEERERTQLNNCETVIAELGSMSSFTDVRSVSSLFARSLEVLRSFDVVSRDRLFTNAGLGAFLAAHGLDTDECESLRRRVASLERALLERDEELERSARANDSLRLQQSIAEHPIDERIKSAKPSPKQVQSLVAQIERLEAEIREVRESKESKDVLQRSEVDALYAQCEHLQAELDYERALYQDAAAERALLQSELSLYAAAAFPGLEVARERRQAELEQTAARERRLAELEQLALFHSRTAEVSVEHQGTQVSMPHDLGLPVQPKRDQKRAKGGGEDVGCQTSQDVVVVSLSKWKLISETEKLQSHDLLEEKKHVKALEAVLTDLKAQLEDSRKKTSSLQQEIQRKVR